MTDTTEYVNEVTSLWLDLCAKAKQHGMDISRWQTNGNKYSVHITYALHKGPRANQFRYQKDVVDYVCLNEHEGFTTKCSAYKALKHLEFTLYRECEKLS